MTEEAEDPSDAPSNYILLRNERIKRNLDRLKMLGLDKGCALILPRTKRKSRAKVRMVQPGKERRSARLRRKAEIKDVDDTTVDEENIMLPYESEDSNLTEGNPNSRFIRTKINVIEISAEEKEALKRCIDNNYLQKFRVSEVSLVFPDRTF